MMANKLKSKQTELNLDPKSVTFETPEEYHRIFEKYNAAFIEKTKMMQALEDDRQKVIEMLKTLYQSHRKKFGSHEDDEKSINLEEPIDSTDDNVPDSIVVTI